jgi:hypothetical protein
MKIKQASMLAAVALASFGVAPVQAVQKHDPVFQKVYSHSLARDPDLLRMVRYQNGSPRRKPDLYVAAPGQGTDANLLDAIRNQNGSPRRK